MAAGRVIVVDDDDHVRKSTARLLRAAGYEVELFSSADAFLAGYRTESGPACLVLDVRMPGATGLDLQDRLRQSESPLAIVFITGHGDIPMSVRALKNGAVDFLPKPFEDIDLLRAVEHGLAKSAQEHAAHSVLESINRRVDTLTNREREVLGLIVCGLLNKQVADRIGTTEKTVKVHRGHIMEKMQVHSFAELVQIAAKVGIAPESGEQ